MNKVVKSAADLDQVCERLITLANERGGPDNITVIAARFEGEGLPPARPSGDVGYHAIPHDSDEHPANPAAPPPPNAADAAPPPAPPEASTAPESIPARRSGSPRTIAVITGVGLVLLGLLYFLLTRQP